MRVEPIDSLDDPRVSAYRAIRERDAARREGVFIAEGRYVVRILLGPRCLYRPRSVFLTPTALDAMRDALEPLPDATPVYLASQELMNAVVGFDIHRGCLASGDRPDAPGAERWIASHPAADQAPIVVLEGLNNHDNIGGILRNAAAFGAAGVLLDPSCADPLYRKSIRVSMGGALVVPHARFESWPGGLGVLADAGLTTIALTPRPDAPDVADVAATLPPDARVALLLGAEGPGLTPGAFERADLHARVAMLTDLVDSLNVSAACAVALHAIARG